MYRLYSLVIPLSYKYLESVWRTAVSPLPQGGTKKPSQTSACAREMHLLRLLSVPICDLLVAALASSLVNVLPIPYVGWILSIIVLLVLILKFTSAEIWAGAALIVVA